MVKKRQSLACSLDLTILHKAAVLPVVRGEYEYTPSKLLFYHYQGNTRRVLKTLNCKHKYGGIRASRNGGHLGGYDKETLILAPRRIV